MKKKNYFEKIKNYIKNNNLLEKVISNKYFLFTINLVLIKLFVSKFSNVNFFFNINLLLEEFGGNFLFDINNQIIILFSLSLISNLYFYFLRHTNKIFKIIAWIIFIIHLLLTFYGFFIISIGGF